MKAAFDLFSPLPEHESVLRFWALVEQGTLALPQCSACGSWLWYPHESGDGCRRADTVWKAVASTGTLYSFTRVHRAFLAGSEAHIPFVVGLVEPDGVEGVRVVANIDDGRSEMVRIGAPVRLRRDPQRPFVLLFEPWEGE